MNYRSATGTPQVSIYGSFNAFFNMLVAGCLLYQCIFHLFNGTNALCAAMVACVSILCRAYAFKPAIFVRTPMQALVIVAFDITSLSGPLVLKTIALQPLIDSLNVPVQTFLLASTALLVVTASHIIYVSLGWGHAIAAESSKKLLSALGFFRPLEVRQILGMFFIGLAISLLLSASGNNTLSKIGDAFGIFVYAPALMIYFAGRTGSATQVPWSTLMAYFAFLLFIGMAGNARETLVGGVAIAVVCWVLARPDRVSLLTGRALVRAALALGFGLIALAAFERLSLAMLVVRAVRDTINLSEMISLTISAFFDERLLQNYRDFERISDIGDYSESYVQSRTLSRLVSTKFQDNVLFYGSFLSPSDLNALVDYHQSMIVGLLPQPMLDFLSLSVDKVDRYTMADLLVNLTTGLPLGGLRSGALIADTWLNFGFAFPLVIAVVAVILFSMIDLCTSNGTTQYAISPLLLLVSWKLLGTLGAWGLSSDSLSSLASVPLRAFPQALVAYAIVCAIVFWLLPDRKPRLMVA